MSYQEFIESKKRKCPASGLTEIPELHPSLFDFQKDLVTWALRRGRAAIFASTGLGKGRMQIEWARHVPGPTIVFAPLAVAQQTVAEAALMGISAQLCREQEDIESGHAFTVTNIDRMHKFDLRKFNAVVIDESSAIKNHTSKRLDSMLKAFSQKPFILCATATPSPNDFTELGTHAELLGVCTRVEMLSEFFFHDGGETQKWTLKHHARKEFWRWVSEWGALVRSPADLGYDGSRYELPELKMTHHRIASDVAVDQANGTLFTLEAKTLTERRNAKKSSMAARIGALAELVNASDEQWIVWCDLNDESTALHKAIPGSVEVKGADSIESKEAALMAFTRGEARVLVSKSSICGFGMNWQQCNHMAFVGMNDSWERFHQAIRRIWRFGQKKVCNVHVFASDLEGEVLRNIELKEANAATMSEELSKETAESVKAQLEGAKKLVLDYDPQEPMSFPDWIRSDAAGARPMKVLAQDIRQGFAMYRGDSCQVLKGIPDESIHYQVFSPPFASLYTYSASANDLGNVRDHAEFFEHFEFMARELFRVLKKGRLLSFHCMLLPTSKERDGFIGLTDFRGDLIRLFQKVGFIFHSEVVIWKDPVTAMQRTKALGLLHKQIRKDSCMSRQGVPDYLVTMRKPGENPERVSHTHEDFPVDLWQNYASPVWMDINPNDTLQRDGAREHDDEKHICPLQLGVIARALKLWTNPGDIVLSPFGGIGSEGVESLRAGRKYLGIELKGSYYEMARKNLDAEGRQVSMF